MTYLRFERRILFGVALILLLVIALDIGAVGVGCYLVGIVMGGDPEPGVAAYSAAHAGRNETI